MKLVGFFGLSAPIRSNKYCAKHYECRHECDITWIQVAYLSSGRERQGNKLLGHSVTIFFADCLLGKVVFSCLIAFSCLKFYSVMLLKIERDIAFLKDGHMWILIRRGIGQTFPFEDLLRFGETK